MSDVPAGWDALEDFERQTFTHEGVARDVYVQGEGPAVIVIHEIPGITPEVAGFGRRVAAEGFTVYLPRLFGDVGRPRDPGYLVGQIARGCISKEFAALALRRSSPVCDALRSLCREAHARHGGPGVGAIGMCFTGNFALALMVDAPVMAPVLSQPSLPFPVSPWHMADLHVSDDELATIQARCADEDLTVLGLRFTHDMTCPGARFARLREVLGDRFHGIEIDSSPGNPYGHSLASHSVVTNDLVDEEGTPTRAALDAVLDLFRRRLHTAS